MFWHTICDKDSVYLTIMIDEFIILEVNLNKEYFTYYDEDKYLIHIAKNDGGFLDIYVPVPTNNECVLQEEVDGNPNTYTYELNGMTYIWTI